MSDDSGTSIIRPSVAEQLAMADFIMSHMAALGTDVPFAPPVESPHIIVPPKVSDPCSSHDSAPESAADSSPRS